MSAQTSCAACACACFFAALVLGLCARSCKPVRVCDAWGLRARGAFPVTALQLTISGRGPALALWCALCLALSATLHASVRVALLIVGLQISSQIAAEVLKRIYARDRPDYWLLGLDPGGAYPSGHACTAVVFFCGWLAVVALSSLPLAAKVPLALLLATWAAGIAWSRLALGAHYLSDVVGGGLLGASWLLAAAAAFAGVGVR